MSRLVLAALTIMTGVPAVAQAGCSYPPEISVPSGRTATEEAMNAARLAVEKYVAELTAYQKCVDDEILALGDAATAEQKAMQTKRYNAASDAINAIGGRFNEEARNYNKAHK